jgi:integrase
MPIRARNGKLEYRFKLSGHEYSHITDLGDTARNRIKAQRLEAEARRLVLDGHSAELRLQVQPFSSAADAFNKWAEGEYSAHPNSWKRLSGSMTGAKVCFGKRPLSSITRGAIEDFKAWRRTVHKVREVTLRHDLHALSLLFQYGQKHNWCRANPIRDVEIPSDKDAVRIHVLSPMEEAKYFAAVEVLRQEKLAHKRPNEARGLEDLRDLATLMLNQGCRPEELRELQQSDIDLERGYMAIQKGKSDAARRSLLLTAASRDVLKERLQTPGKWIFSSAKNPGQHIGQAQRLHAAALKRAAVSFVLYDCRHTFATRAVERGMEIPKLMAILGHSNLRSIMKYVHMTQAHIDDGMRKFEAAVLPAVCPLATRKNGEEKGKAGMEREASEMRSKLLN